MMQQGFQSLSGLRVVLLGNSWPQRAAAGNFIFQTDAFVEESRHCVRVSRTLEGKEVVVINTPDVLLSEISDNSLTEEMKQCQEAAAPGPHVFLLVLQPETFIEDHKVKICRFLERFSDRSYDHSLVLTSNYKQSGPTTRIHWSLIREVIRKCQFRHLQMNDLEHAELLTRLHQIVKENNGEHLSYEAFQDAVSDDPSEDQSPRHKSTGSRIMGAFKDRKYETFREDHKQLMETMQKVVDENKGTFLTATEDTSRPKSEDIQPALNLVLFGRKGAGKTSAARTILGQRELQSDTNSSVINQGSVFGRRVSVVELPAMFGKPQEAVMKESFRSVSLCGHEGVHVFILVLPVGPLTGEDKVELEIIEKTFSSAVKDFSMILFTVESDPRAPAFVNVERSEDIQEVCQNFGGRYVIFNIRDSEQVTDVFHVVENMSKQKPHSYTTERLYHALMDKVIQLETNLKKTMVTGDAEKQSSDCLRVMLIGKTGNGKSSSGNTLLGREAFKEKQSKKPVTTQCQKEESEVNGQTVVVVDTSGLFDTNLTHDEVNEEMVKCISLLAPGPHVFLLVLQIGRFTEEEKQTLKHIKEAFGKNSEKFTIILFTHGDNLKETSIDDYIRKNCDESFQKLVDDCGGRYHVFNNKDRNRSQVGELMEKINTMVKENNATFYTNEMLQEAELAIKKEMERLLKEKEEEMERERKELERKRNEETQRIKREIEEERRKMQKEKELKEMQENLRKEKEQRKKQREGRERKDRKGKRRRTTHRN